jgi:DNA primase|nr:MAG TPA: DNA directed DNA polymerase [Caudoviricetes sp.]
MKITNQFKSKLKTYFIKRLGAFEYKHGWMKLPTCPYCHRELKMGVNLSMYRTNCFRCNEHPNPSQLVMDVEGFDTYHELINFLNNGQFEELEFHDEKIELAEAKPLYLPNSFRLLSIGDSQIARSIRSYVKGRGFSIEELCKHGVGYATREPFFGYLIIPFYYHGQLRYYNARKVIGNGPRYNNPNKDITGLGKEFIIFNYDALEMYRSVFICEGALNALTLGDRAIATMGKAISAYQVNELLKSSCERFIILLDPDAKEYAINLALKLVAYKKVKVVFLPDGKDVNDLGRSQTLKLVYATRYQSYQELISIRNSLK